MGGGEVLVAVRIFCCEREVNNLMTPAKQFWTNRVTNASWKHIDDNLVRLKACDMCQSITFQHRYLRMRMECFGHVEIDDGNGMVCFQ